MHTSDRHPRQTPRPGRWHRRLLPTPPPPSPSQASRFDAWPEGAPEWLVKGLASGLAGLAQSLEDSAEFGRIGRYYAVEDMLTTDPADKYGRTTLRQHYERIAVEGQEYDPYTSVFGNKGASESFKEGASP